MTETIAAPRAADDAPPPAQRDPGIEAQLASFGLAAHQVAWRPDTPLDEIDAAASLKNQARLEGKLDREHVDALALALQDGAVLPPLVAYAGPRALLVLVDGNHRLAAVRRAGRPTVPLYVVRQPAPGLVDFMTRTWNAGTGGKAVAREHVLEQGFALVDLGYPLEEVARRLRMPVTTLGDKRREREVRRRFFRVGVAGADAIAHSTATRLNQLQSDVQLKAVAELIVRAGMKLEQATDLVRRCIEAGSDARALAIVEDAQRAYEEGLARLRADPHLRAVEPTARRIGRWLDSIRKAYLSGKSPHVLGYDTADEVARTRGLLADVQRAADHVLTEAERQIARATR